ncbi:Tetratricopeptide repeat-like superfamily protein, putative isoform 2 [Hibiscus syriacus]|uniref:Tetratricopeptide repeat-like superfamily protein, putative isoform 2 n=1 Tax=Hibiscus syriacus TaxID=106335 RepID=A0A6A2YKM8_HIBSY|nr:Tetratricopeptide repeat-like superfamily protein, putative isoform 2 [Hibiscus syriacus]
MRAGLRPDSYSVVAALSACGKSEDLLNGKLIHGLILKYNLGFKISIVGNALIDMYSRNGEIIVAELVFDCMYVKDVASWNSLLNGFILCNDLEASRRVFDKMPKRNEVSWSALISGYVKKVNLDAKKNVVLSNALMDMYSKCGYLGVAGTIFNEMCLRDVFSWTIMITGCAFHGKGKQALQLFSDMKESNVAPNEVTFLSLVSACNHEGLFVEGQELFRDMVRCYGFKPMIEHYGCVVDLLGRAGLLEEAKMLIDEMPMLPDAVIWRSLICACLTHGELDLAEAAGEKLMKLEPEDDGAYALLSHVYLRSNRHEDALRIRKLMRNKRIRKIPGCSWIEVNGSVHQFLAEDAAAAAAAAAGDIYWILECIGEPNREFLWLELE